MRNATKSPIGSQSIEGVLRAVDLDRGKIVIRDQHAKYNVEGVDDTVDDVIGSMFNRQVVVLADARSPTKFLYKTISVSGNKDSDADKATLFDLRT